MSKIEEQFPEFVHEVKNLTTDQLKNRIATLQQVLAESEAHKEENDALKSARAQVSELNGPYLDVRKAVKLKTAHILDLLKEKP